MQDLSTYLLLSRMDERQRSRRAAQHDRTAHLLLLRRLDRRRERSAARARLLRSTLT